MIYTAPILWLPMDPVGAGSWNSTATNTAGEEYSFTFTYDGLDTLIAGQVASPETLSCWRILVEQDLVTPSATSAGGQRRDGMGIVRDGFGSTKAATADTLWYEAGVLPRRRIAFRTQYPQNELLYSRHTTRDTPVEVKGGSFGSLRSRFGR